MLIRNFPGSAASSARLFTGESLETARTTRAGLFVALEYVNSPSETTSLPRSSTQSRPGDAQIEQPFGHVGRDLLRSQDAHVIDAGIVDRGPVGHVRGARRRPGRRPRRVAWWRARASLWAGPGEAWQRSSQTRAVAGPRRAERRRGQCAPGAARAQCAPGSGRRCRSESHGLGFDAR